MEFQLKDISEPIENIESYLSSRDKMIFFTNSIKNGYSSELNGLFNIFRLINGSNYGFYLSIDKKTIVIIQLKLRFKVHIWTIKISSFQEKDFDSLKEIMNIEFNPCNSLIDLENDLRSILDTLIKPYDL